MNTTTDFADGKLIADGLEHEISSIGWDPHPSFKGVYLKHIMRGSVSGNRLSCHLVKIEPWCKLEMHTHDRKMELHEVIKGDGVCIIDDEKFDYRPGIISYIPDGIKHSVKAGSEGLQILAKFSPALI